jgi:hypothetical protein
LSARSSEDVAPRTPHPADVVPIFFFADGVVLVDLDPPDPTSDPPPLCSMKNRVGARTMARLVQSILFSSERSATEAKNLARKMRVAEWLAGRRQVAKRRDSMRCGEDSWKRLKQLKKEEDNCF